MDWTPEAEAAIKKVPFFVRKKVRARVEEEARKNNQELVTIAEVKATQKHYLSGMSSEVKGYQLDACFGPSGCPNAIGSNKDLVQKIEQQLISADFLGFLKTKGVVNFKFHHEFRVTVADCPNACSQPQIKDIGIIAATVPGISEAECTACQACADKCREEAIRVNENPAEPLIDLRRCLACGQCIPVCPTHTLVEKTVGYRIQIGGKLGRHPHLAHELPGIYSAATILDILNACIDLYKSNNQRGERFGQILQPSHIEDLQKRFTPMAL